MFLLFPSVTTFVALRAESLDFNNASKYWNMNRCFKESKDAIKVQILSLEIVWESGIFSTQYSCIMPIKLEIQSFFSI
jgi:hypothetical protein